MFIEIERKFLVNRAKWAMLEKPAGSYYRQGYLTDDDHKTIRVRVAPLAGFLTIKGVSSGISRSEFEYEIPREEAIHLLDNFSQSEIVKTRYNIWFEGKLWEVDVFAGDNDGLIVAEIELQNEVEGFVLPEWVNEEVTEDTRYYNSSLSKNPYSKWNENQN